MIIFTHIYSFFSLSIAEASCRSAIDAARSIVADVGREVASSSTGLVDLAQCNKHSSERDCARVLSKKYALTLPIKKSILDTPDSSVKLPVLEMASWVEFMLKQNCWHMLVGHLKPNPQREERILEAFWSNFRKMSPSHDVFRLAAANQLVLSRTCPVVLHGDEGRGRKHSAYLVVSWRSLLGRGLHPAREHQRVHGAKKLYAKQKCNYIGHSYTTRYMLAGLRKTEYTGENASVFDALMTFCAREAHNMAMVGVADVTGKKHWMMMLYITGDWPWLHKSGNFTRSFNNVLKSTSQQAARGICHLCAAGQDHVPFEQVNTTRPIWWGTQYQDPPSEEASPFQIVPHIPGQFGAFWCFDFFHTWHLGVARVWIGGTLALLSMLENGSNVDERFASLSSRYKAFCIANKRRAHIQKLTKEAINWITTRAFPVGSWHKGELSTVLMDFIEAEVPVGRRCDDEPMLALVAEGTFAINEAIRQMYRSDLWLYPDESRRIAGYGCRFLRRFSELAHQGLVRGMNLFVMIPKIHVLQKMFLQLHFAAQNNIPKLNPLSTSVQQCEDFIGRPSRLARRVAGGQIACERVLERYLAAAYFQWIEAGLLVRPV